MFYTDKLMSALESEAFWSYENLCIFQLQQCEQDKWHSVDVMEWVYNLLNSKPQHLQSNDYLNNLYLKNEKNFMSEDLVKIVMFSNLHVDYNYTEGSSNTCGEIICCRGQ